MACKKPAGAMGSGTGGAPRGLGLRVEMRTVREQEFLRRGRPGRDTAWKTEEQSGEHMKLSQKVVFYFYKQQTLGRKAELKWT